MRSKIITTLGAVLLAAALTAAPAGQDQKPSPTSTKKTTRATSEDTSMSADMREAIAWERKKDAAAARWANIEASQKTERIAASKPKPKQ